LNFTSAAGVRVLERASHQSVAVSHRWETRNFWEMRNAWFSAALAAALMAVASWGNSAKAGVPATSADRKLSEVVVTAKRQPDPAADARLQVQVEAALAADAYFNSEHVSVTVRNGVATLHGIIFDDWDLRNAIRISRRIPGVRRVVNDLEIKLGGE
jgi:osmotically-inducible protein OsmY